jgi:L-ascorbate metabolism protein UlaG (beta-lactamase superfamily)
LNEENTDLLSAVDVLFVPAGGGDAITPEQAAEITTELEPKVVVPIRYRTSSGDKDLAPVDEFCKHLGIDVPEAQEKLILKPSDLGETTQLFLLTPNTK